MTCDDRAVIGLFFGDLPVSEAARVQRHAAGCAGCTRTLEGLRSERSLFCERRSAPPSLDRMFAEVTRRIAIPRKRWWSQLSVRSLVPVGGACLAVLLALLSPSVSMPGALDGSTADAENVLSMCIAGAHAASADELMCVASAPVAPARSPDSSAALACF